MPLAWRVSATFSAVPVKKMRPRPNTSAARPGAKVPSCPTRTWVVWVMPWTMLAAWLWIPCPTWPRRPLVVLQGAPFSRAVKQRWA